MYKYLFVLYYTPRKSCIASGAGHRQRYSHSVYEGKGMRNIDKGQTDAGIVLVDWSSLAYV